MRTATEVRWCFPHFVDSTKVRDWHGQVGGTTAGFPQEAVLILRIPPRADGTTQDIVL